MYLLLIILTATWAGRNNILNCIIKNNRYQILAIFEKGMTMFVLLLKQAGTFHLYSTGKLQRQA